MKVIFDREGIIEILDNYPYREDAVGIFDRGDAGFLEEEDQRCIIEDTVSSVMKWDTGYLKTQAHNCLRKKQNGKFAKGAVTTLIDIEIAKYVTDFTSCWFHDRIALRAIDEDTVVVSFEGTQTTH